MAICGYEFPDGVVCGQSLGHENQGVPHIPWGDGEAYWRKRRETRVYLEYDHSQDFIGPRDNEYIGPFDSENEAASFRSVNIAPSAPVRVVILEAAPSYAMTPAELIKYQHRMD